MKIRDMGPMHFPPSWYGGPPDDPDDTDEDIERAMLADPDLTDNDRDGLMIPYEELFDDEF